jgi:hypothetical protein
MKALTVKASAAVKAPFVKHHKQQLWLIEPVMSLPRRVPWANQEEYEEVFGSNGDLEAQRRAVNRVCFSKC